MKKLHVSRDAQTLQPFTLPQRGEGRTAGPGWGEHRKAPHAAATQRPSPRWRRVRGAKPSVCVTGRIVSKERSQ